MPARKTYLLPLFALVALLFSCHESRTPALDTARELMNEHPDSALVILESLDPDSGMTATDRAVYGLLLTQARYKNFIDETDDSLITACAGYLIDHGSKADASTALFLAGMVRRNAGNSGKAATALLHGLDIARENSLPFEEGLCAKGLYELFSTLFDGERQLRYAAEACDAFARAGTGDWTGYAALDLATAYNNNFLHDRAIATADSLLAVAQNMGDTILAAETHALLGMSHFARGDYAPALRNYTDAHALDPTALKENDLQNVATAISQLPPEEVSPEARALAKKADSTAGFVQPFEILAAKGDFEGAYRSLDDYRRQQDEVLQRLITTDVSGAVHEYEQRRGQLARERMMHERMAWVAFAILVVVAAGVVVLLYRSRLRRQQLHRESVIAKADLLSADLAREKETNTQLSGMARELFKQKFGIVNRLCSAYYEGMGIKLEKKRIVAEVEGILKDISENPDTMKELEEYVDKYASGLMTDFRTDFPTMKPEDYRLFLYSAIGLSSRSIAIFLDEKIDVIYNRRSRLKARIRELGEDRASRYLAYLS